MKQIVFILTILVMLSALISCNDAPTDAESLSILQSQVWRYRQTRLYDKNKTFYFFDIFDNMAEGYIGDVIEDISFGNDGIVTIILGWLPHEPLLMSYSVKDGNLILDDKLVYTITTINNNRVVFETTLRPEEEIPDGADVSTLRRRIMIEKKKQ